MPHFLIRNQGILAVIEFPVPSTIVSKSRHKSRVTQELSC